MTFMWVRATTSMEAAYLWLSCQTYRHRKDGSVNLVKAESKTCGSGSPSDGRPSSGDVSTHWFKALQFWYSAG